MGDYMSQELMYVLVTVIKGGKAFKNQKVEWDGCNSYINTDDNGRVMVPTMKSNITIYVNGTGYNVNVNNIKECVIDYSTDQVHLIKY
jgi:uncharacterized protein YxeA